MSAGPLRKAIEATIDEAPHDARLRLATLEANIAGLATALRTSMEDFSPAERGPLVKLLAFLS